MGLLNVIVFKVKPDALEPKLATKVISEVAILLLKPSPVITKLGFTAPAARLEIDAICGIDGILETVTVYVVVLPSCAVTTIDMTFSPTLSEMDPDAVPELTFTPPTEIVAFESFRVGVTVIDSVALETIAV
ncbi:MAG: hypothetical protein EB134_05390 [Actinobacteria bacterium]|nr:hypothetical protein [Actinomycetota bacterium]